MSSELIHALGALGYVYTLSVGDDVNYMRPELVQMMPKYKRIRDCLEGEDAIKAGREIYLPILPYSDNPKENNARYENYLKRAVFYPVLKQTSQGLRGQCFLNKPICDLPNILEPMKENIDGSSDVFQFSSEALGTNINFGRGGILTDMMMVVGDPSVKDNERNMPFFTKYEPENIINWRYRMVMGRQVLSKVVLREFYDTEKYTYSIDIGVRFRVLSLDKNGFYNVEVFVIDEEGNYVHEKIDGKEIGVIYPKAGNKKMDYIPFEPLVAEKKSLDYVCTPQMDSLASMNIGHFRNSADYEESCFMNGQGTMILTGITKNWYTDVLKGKVRLGSLGVIPLEKGADGKILQINPNSMPIEAMRHKEEQMLSLGAKIFQPSTIVKTATESSMNKADENSILTCTAKNTSVAITNSFKTSYFMKTGKRSGDEYDKIKFELITESAVTNLTVQEQLQLVASWQAFALTDAEMRSKFKQAGYAWDDTWKPPTPEQLNPTVDVTQKKKVKSKGTVSAVSGKDLEGNKNNN